MMEYVLWHHPRCSQSRKAFALLEERGIAFQTRLYLREVPTVAELQQVLHKLDISATNLIRKTERVFKEIPNSDSLSSEEWIEWMHRYPILIQRPILMDDHQAKIGRPPENIFNLSSLTAS